MQAGRGKIPDQNNHELHEYREYAKNITIRVIRG
jgi:hypothetical protein